MSSVRDVAFDAEVSMQEAAGSRQQDDAGTRRNGETVIREQRSDDRGHKAYKGRISFILSVFALCPVPCALSLSFHHLGDVLNFRLFNLSSGFARNLPLPLNR